MISFMSCFIMFNKLIMKSTITIDKELSRELEILKGSKTWNEFLKELLVVYKEYKNKET